MNELLKSMACSGSECLCWILVLLNIFAVFYLVFCSFWKISGLTKIIGWTYSGVLIGAPGLIMFFHTCIYTLLATIFTGMMLMAILSIILPQRASRDVSERDKSGKPVGAYLISETLDGWFAFGLYDYKRKNLINSTYVYDSIEAAKAAVASCRENGIIAETEDRSGNWIQEKHIPKFEVRKYGEAYGFALRVVEGDSIIHSSMFSKASVCLSLLEKVKANIGAADVYMSVDNISGDGYKKWGDMADMPAIEEDIDLPVQELGSNDASEKEDKNLPKECVAFVVWPENPDQVYQYKVPDGNVEVGDSVVAPTYDAFNQKEVIRKARVVKVGYYEQADDGISTRKTVISVEKK